MDFTNFDIDELMGMGDDSNPLMMLIWILPVIIFIFYGQRIQLFITSGEIKKSIDKLDSFRDESKKELFSYLKNNLSPISNIESKLDKLFEYFTIMPVDIDPNGIMPKINHLIRSREDYTRNQIALLFSDIDKVNITKVQNLVEIVTTLQLMYKITRHLFLTAKKQKNFPLILPLQMMIPFVMEEAEALKEAVSAIEQGQPIGDGIGPMVVGDMMRNTTKQEIAFETIYSESKFEERKLHLVKAEGPYSTVGRLGEAAKLIIEKNKPDLIIMVDAALKLEGEESAETAQGFGAAIGGIGTERFQIEEIATNNKIPVFAIVIKQSIKEAVTLMTKEISEKAISVKSDIHQMIRENSKPGQSIIILGVGNTIGVSQ